LLPKNGIIRQVIIFGGILMVVQEKIRGFICITAHPEGCAKNVQSQLHIAKMLEKCPNPPKRVLVIGASTGYGLASLIASLSVKAETIGVFFEKPAKDKRTASAGYYNIAEFGRQAERAGIYHKSINGDAFSTAISQKTIETIKKDWPEGVDLVIYSLASPKRTDPVSGETYQSVLKPIGKAYTSKTVDFMSGAVSEVNLEPATPEEIQNTVKVMGGEDWQRWMDAMIQADVLARGAMTLAYSYIGPEITYPIYRHGTIGRAKEHLEQTAIQLNQQLQRHCDGNAYVSVNKGLVTQASSAIPVVPLYISMLYKIMKQKQCHEGCIEQIVRLFAERLYTGKPIPTDDHHRIRLDDWEMRDEVQQQVATLWPCVDNTNVEQYTDLDGYRQEFIKLFGFGLESIDYQHDVDIDVVIPDLVE
jgi:enoyl-[acyl-carrier protein] reductase / trans-2-enoyl-CoA reductase (NAD+)